MEKLKFFDQTFRMLLSLTFTVWVLYILLLALFAGEADNCNAVTSRFFTLGAWAAGILSAPPLLYGLARILFWPNGTKNGPSSGIVLVVGSAIFVTVATLFALAISKYGCL